MREFIISRALACIVVSLVFAGCEPGIDEFGILNPTGCVRCHGGLGEGEWVQPGAGHPDAAAEGEACESCHGGDPNTLAQGKAHEDLVPDGSGPPTSSLGAGIRSLQVAALVTGRHDASPARLAALLGD